MDVVEETTYTPQLRYYYADTIFEAGTLAGSVHPENVVYLALGDPETDEIRWRHEWTRDEACAVISVLAHALMSLEGDLEPLGHHHDVEE